MATLRVGVLSGDRFFREGVHRILAGDASLRTAVDSCAPREAVPETADVLLVDSRLDDVLARCARRTGDRPHWVFLSVPDDRWAAEAIVAGARGVIRDIDPISDVIRAIPLVNRGGIWAPRHVVVEACLRGRRDTEVEASPGAALEERLSLRERQVVRCVMSGMGNKELADRLSISPATAKAHLTHIFRKLGVQGRGELMAVYHGTLPAGILVTSQRPPHTAISGRAGVAADRPKVVRPRAN